ncbi:MAG: hypothetical protein KGJ84_06910 [Elusimicrobia bacterium]|nr:hypothetical protein [Elusimicrobiota bacterium]
MPLEDSGRKAVLIALLCPGVAAAQAAGAGAFLRQEPDARSAALSGATGAAAEDASAVLVNPAALARLGKPEIGATRVLLFQDTTFDVVSGGWPTRRWGSFGAAYVRQASAGFESRAGPNDQPTNFSIEQSALIAGWGISPRFSWEAQDTPADARLLSVGAAVKSVQEKIGAVSGSGSGLDAGLILRPQADVSLGVTAGNLIAPSPSFLSGGVPYERTFEISGAYSRPLDADWRLLLVSRLRRVETEGNDVAGGVELQYGRLAALRLGGRGQGLSTGFGVSFGNTRVDYAVVLHDLGLLHSLTLIQRFGQTREELEETIRRGISRLSRADGARLAKVYLQKADAEGREGRATEARRDIEAASLLDPGNANIAARLKRADAAWEEALHRQTVERLSALAQQQEEQGNLLAARQYWRSVLDLDSSHPRALRGIEFVDRALSNVEKARAESLRQAETANEIAMGLSGAAASLSRGQLRQARLEAEKISSRHPENKEVSQFLLQIRNRIESFTTARLAEADKATQARDYPRALAALEAARREDPENPEIKRRDAAAQDELRRTLSAETRKQAEQLYYRAVDQYLKGRYDAAGALSDEVLKLDPSSDPARTLKQKVDAAKRYSR